MYLAVSRAAAARPRAVRVERVDEVGDIDKDEHDGDAEAQAFVEHFGVGACGGEEAALRVVEERGHEEGDER